MMQGVAMATVFDPFRLGAIALDVLATHHTGAKGIQARQQVRLQRLVAAAERGSAYYQVMLSPLTREQWSLSDLPVVHKSILMQHFDQWVTDPAIRLSNLRSWVSDPHQIGRPYLGRYLVWESSGSSHEPGLFIQDAQSMAVYDALEALRCHRPRPMLRWLDPWFLSEKMVFIGALEGHFSSVVSMQRLRQIHPCLAQRLHCFSILQPQADWLGQIQQLQPTIVATYPSVACVLADAVQRGALHCTTQELWLGGETLSVAVRKHLVQVLGCVVRNSYGASECMAIGWECSQGKMHANTDWVILEAVNAAGQPVAPGTLSHTTLLTNLANHVQPLIRYDLGDQIVIQPEPCGCGAPFPVIEVMGRKDEALTLLAEDGTAITLLPLAITTVLEEQAGVFDFQLVQTAPRGLSLKLPASTSDAAVCLVQCAQVLQQFVRAMGLRGIQISTCTVPALARGNSGKVQRIMNAYRD
jgi:phenylacetate-coenzyme A ligase PaaK-like adenylate-forming protein